MSTVVSVESPKLRIASDEKRTDKVEKINNNCRICSPKYFIKSKF